MTNILTKIKINAVVRKHFELVFESHLFAYPILSLGLALTFLSMWISSSSAQSSVAYIRMVRALELDETGLSEPAGLAFSSRANAFQVVEAPGPGQLPPIATDVIQLTPFADWAGSARIAAQVKDPINVTFDNKTNRLLILQSPANILIEVLLDGHHNLDPAMVVRHNALRFGLENPQGMTVDPGSGELFILDTVGPRIVRVEPGAGGGFENAVISEVDLQPTGLAAVRGLAFDPTSGHLHLVSVTEHKLYELTQAGEVVATRDLSEFGLTDPQGMVFAPSGDQTDDPLQLSLYLADSGIVAGQGQGRLSPQGGQMDVQSTEGNAVAQGSGQIVELSFTALAAPAASSFTSSLIRTTDMSVDPFSPPSPDPSGLAYLPNSDTLLMCDGEVEEIVRKITHFQGVNVWEMTLGGGVVRTANISTVAPTVVPMTDEPTGVAWIPANGHFFFSDDSDKEVFDLDPGPDGQLGTTDDTWTSFDTAAAGSSDPEGITYDSWHDHLFVADGVNMEVYEFTRSGSPVSHFDVGQYGVADPESVEFNPYSGTLFVLSSNHTSPVAVETDLSGALIRTIDISAAGSRNAAGLAYAPASDGSGAQRFYIVDRGIDNNSDPNIIDGKMYEMTAPSPSTPDNTPPVVNAGPDRSITLPAVAILDGTVTDDGLPNPPGAVTVVWSKASGPGTVTFADASAVDTTAGFSSSGSYLLRLTANDGELYGSDDMNVEVAGGNTPPVAGDDGYTTDEDVTLNVPAPGVLGNDSDVDEDSLTAVLVGDVTDGTLTLNSDGSFEYIPNLDFNGTDIFTYVANDGIADSNVATVTITVNPVNDPPVANDDAYSTNEDVKLQLAAPGVLSNDSNGDGGSLTALLVGDVSNGTLTLKSDGSLGYTPEVDFNGVDTFTYKANNGTADSNVATVTITVNAVNDPPAADANGPYSGSIDVPVHFDGSGSTDVDGTIVSFEWDFGDGSTETGVSANHKYATAGTYTIVLTVTDNEGAMDSDITSANIHVTSNQAPTAVEDIYTANKGVALAVSAPGVLSNDGDPDGDSLAAVLVTGPSRGNLILNSDGSFTYIADMDFKGMDTFSYKAYDGKAYSNVATVTITMKTNIYLPVIVEGP